MEKKLLFASSSTSSSFAAIVTVIVVLLSGFAQGIRPLTLATSCAADILAIASISSLPFSTTNLSCNAVWSSQDMNLLYQNTGPNKWSIFLSAPANGGYISIGFSPSGTMVGSDAIAGWVGSDGSGVAKQYHLGGYTSAECTPDTGSLKLAAGRMATILQSSRLFLAFELDAGTPQNGLILAVGPDGQLPASNGLLPKHQTMQSTTVDFSSAASAGGQNSPPSSPTALVDSPPSGRSPTPSPPSSSPPSPPSPPPSTSSSSCSAKFVVDDKLIPFDASSGSCYNPWSSQDFALLFKRTSPSLWSFVLSVPDTGGYISVGFSPNGKMVGSSAVAGWKSSSGTAIVKQYYLGGTSSGSCPPDQGSLQLVPGSTVLLSQSSRLFLAFQLNSTEPSGHLVYAVGPRKTVPGSDGHLPMHADMTSTYINYATGESSTVGKSTESLRTAHGMLALLGWGVAIPIGMAMARYWRHYDPFWYYSHVSIQTLGSILGFLALITGFSLKKKVEKDVDSHESLGIVILVLGFLQVMAFLIRPGKDAKVRRYWNWYHHNVGRMAIILAVANIFYGISLTHDGGTNPWNVGYGIFLGLWIVSCLALEIRMRWCSPDCSIGRRPFL